jgi:hypothetical protein
MKKNKILFLIALFAIVISCTDESLDPLKFKEVKKGTLLVLRGDALDALYFNGEDIAVVAPLAADGTEKFNFDAEFLSADLTSLASVDVYVLKGAAGNTTRVLLTNVPFSSFKTDATYRGPWVSISLPFKDMLAKLGLPNTFPLSQATIDTLLDLYGGGINIECDLNLTDGSKILAADITAAGLFASDQFYPAMRLNYPILDYCILDINSWAGSYTSVETPGTTETNVIRKDLLVNNRLIMDNWWGDGVDVYFDMIPSTDPFDQNIVIPTQTTSENGVASGTGTYDQCNNTITLKAKYVIGGSTYNFIYALSPE